MYVGKLRKFRFSSALFVTRKRFYEKFLSLFFDCAVFASGYDMRTCYSTNVFQFWLQISHSSKSLKIFLLWQWDFVARQPKSQSCCWRRTLRQWEFAFLYVVSLPLTSIWTNIVLVRLNEVEVSMNSCGREGVISTRDVSILMALVLIDVLQESSYLVSRVLIDIFYKVRSQWIRVCSCFQTCQNVFVKNRQ